MTEAEVKGQYELKTYSTFTLPAITEAGAYEFSMRVVKVNGQDNMDQSPEAVTSVIVLNTVPKKRTLMEEYTGTWCGWCTRGFVALELLKKNYPDDFVTISYHYSDPMEIITPEYYPSPVSGYPGAWIDRGMSVDPYGGDDANYDESHFSTLDILQWRNSMFANAAIDLNAQLNETEEEINVTATVTFPYSDDNANYQLEYVLVEDGMTGPSGTDWDQQNNYSGNSGVSADLQGIASMGSVISNLVFNDVAVGTSYNQNGVNQAPALGTMTGGEKRKVSYTLSLPTKATLRTALKKSTATTLNLFRSYSRLNLFSSHSMALRMDSMATVPHEA